MLSVLAGTLVLSRDCASAISLPPELVQHGKGTLPFVLLRASISADVSDCSLEDVICSFSAPWVVVFHRLLEGFRLSFAAAEGCDTALDVPPAFFGEQSCHPCSWSLVWSWVSPALGAGGSTAGTVTVAADGTGALLTVRAPLGNVPAALPVPVLSWLPPCATALWLSMVFLSVPTEVLQCLRPDLLKGQ